MSNRSLSILAGGFSRRFQKKKDQWLDKALLQIEEKPLLVHLVKSGIGLYSSVNISVNSSSRKREYNQIIDNYLSDTGLSFIIDSEKIALNGVLRGIYSVFQARKNTSVQFVPSDRPYIDLRILRGLKVQKDGVSILSYNTGMIEPLLALYGSDSNLPEIYSQLPLSRADVPIRHSNTIEIYSIDEILNRNGISFRIFSNINIQSDIVDDEMENSSLSTIDIPSPMLIKRKQPDFSINDYENEKKNEIIESLIEIKNYYSAFLLSFYLWEQKEISKEEYKAFGIDSLTKEYKFWLNKEMPFLALHALDDLVRYFPEERKSSIEIEINELRKKMKIEPRKIQ